ncbi:hypothetical protein [Polaribacter irgensii]|nr:hypothetical protein [Polaribacter irgensii]
MSIFVCLPILFLQYTTDDDRFEKITNPLSEAFEMLLIQNNSASIDV